MIRRALLAAALAVPLLACPSSSVRADAVPLRILAVGDSISVGGTSPGSGRWQDELDRLLMEAGVAHTITTYAVGGTDCYYWTSRIAAILAAAQPDLVIVYCGTNDDPAAVIWGEPKTSWSMRVLIETSHGYRTPPPLVLPTLIGYADPTIAPAGLPANEAATNDHIYSQLWRYRPPQVTPSWLAGIADVQQMPGTARYLDGDGCDPRTSLCGFHPNARGYKTVGRIMYDSAQAGMGWPTAVSMGEPPLCDMAGHRTGYPRPTYTPCVG